MVLCNNPSEALNKTILFNQNKNLELKYENDIMV